MVFKFETDNTAVITGSWFCVRRTGEKLFAIPTTRRDITRH